MSRQKEGRHEKALFNNDQQIFKNLRDPLINRRYGELAFFLKSMLYQFRIGEWRLLGPIRSWR